MNCPICNTLLIHQTELSEDSLGLYVAEDCESSQEVFSNSNILYFKCSNNHSVYLEEDELKQ